MDGTRTGTGGGLTLLDGAALVVGAAVASVHFGGAIPGQVTGVGWALFWAAFAGVGVTAAGPWLFVFRRFVRRPPGYPRVGDALWAALGLPWVATAPLLPPRAGRAEGGELYGALLSVGIGLASMAALTVVWKTWVVVPRAEAGRVGSSPWTNRLGLALAIAWPLQCAFGLLLLESGGLW